MPASRPPAPRNIGGLSVSKPDVENHPSGPPRHGEFGQAERAFTLASTFLSGVLAISASQFIGAPLKFIDPEFYEAYMAYTKESFAVLITSLTQWWAPTVVRVSGDLSVRGQLIQAKDGSLECRFPERLVLMANHQLYTDWLYLWWIAYTNRMHGRIYIILKESLKNIPIVGWGCQFYNFIFLSRKWETDMPRFKEALSHLKKKTNPMWLLIFPEGTNLSATTRAKSKAWAEKNNLQDMKHQLLPRSTGLRFCLQELAETTDWLYDCTIAYEGVPAGQFGQDIFTLRSSFLEGRPPKSVNMHWRRFKIADIPINNSKAFDVWLRNRWREKDYMLEYFSRHSRFPADNYWKEHLADVDTEKGSSSSIRSVAKAARTIETEVKSGKFEEFLRIFAPITALSMALFLAYGASPDQLPFAEGGQFLQEHLGALMGTMGSLGNMSGSPGDLEKLLEGGPSLPKMPSNLKMGNTPADKAKQQKYLKLFKESLPPEISIEAEQRKRVQSFINSLPSKEEAKRAAIAGAKAPLAQRGAAARQLRQKAATVVNEPDRKINQRNTKAHSIHGGPSTPRVVSSVNKAPTTSQAKPKTKGAPRYAKVNGVMIQLESNEPEPDTSKAGSQYVQTRNGLRIKQPASQNPPATTKLEEPKKQPEFITTAGGIKIKNPSAQSSTSVAKTTAKAVPKVTPSLAAKTKTNTALVQKPIVRQTAAGHGSVKKTASQPKAGATAGAGGSKVVLTPSGPRTLKT